MSFSSLLHLLFHLLILSPSSLSSPPRRKETLNYQQISHKPVDKPQSIGGIIPSSSERPRKQNNEREILQNIKMSELLQGVFLTGVLNLKLSVRKLSWPYTQCFLLHIAAEPFNGSADIAAAASTAAVTAFLEHIITEAVYGQESFRTLWVYGQESFRTLTVYGQESFRTLQCTIKRVCDGTLSVRLSTPLNLSPIQTSYLKVCLLWGPEIYIQGRDHWIERPMCCRPWLAFESNWSLARTVDGVKRAPPLWFI